MFNLEELKNPMSVGQNFTKNFTADVAVEIFRNASNNTHSCFSWQIYQSITVKSNLFTGRKYMPSNFWKRQREKNLARHIAVKKNKKKKNEQQMLAGALTEAATGGVL